MGGDHGIQVVIPAALEYLQRGRDVDLILVGDEAQLRTALGKSVDHPNIRVHHASQQVAMDELPSKALRGKKDSSMRVAIDLVKSGEAMACVSAGNTGALMGIARFVLKTLPEIDRPAIATALPTLCGHALMLDLGANVDSSAEHLYQFAVMGSELVAAVDEIASPRVGLLNIGQEEMKGNEQVKMAHEILSKASLNYIGYVEADKIFKGGVDVVVCDGFVGNVALKSMEGVANMISQIMKREFYRNAFTKTAGLIARPVLQRLREGLDPRKHNGASLLGLRGIVIKSHGGADVMAYENAIATAEKEIEADVPNRIIHRLGVHLERK